MKSSILACILGLAFLGIYQTPSAQARDDKSTNAPAATTNAPAPVAHEVAVFKTSEGTMVIEFWPDSAPNTVKNFIKLAKSGFYDGTRFHRIIKGFMIQGGDPLSKDVSKKEAWGTGDPGYKIKAEFNDRSHQFGVISMARGGDPDSAGSQFFICNGDASQLDHQYTAFGKLIKGDDVLKKLSDLPVHPDRRGEPSAPNTPPVLESVKIVPADSIK